MKERNQNMLNSFEAKLLESVQALIDLRLKRINHLDTLDEPTEEDTQLGPYIFTNESIKNELIAISEAKEDTDKKGIYYSAEIGTFGQAKITTVLKSKFKARLPIPKKIRGKAYRCVEFNKAYLDRLKTSYEVTDKIEIVGNPVTPVTAVTPPSNIKTSHKVVAEGVEGNNDIKITENKLKDHDNYNPSSRNETLKDENKGNTLPEGVTGVTTVTEKDFEKKATVTAVTAVTEPETEQKKICPKCGEESSSPYWFKHHNCEQN